MACDAEKFGFQMLSVDEIVTSVQEESNPVDEQTDEDEDNNNNESSKGPSNADVFSALETAMEWYEQQSECCPTQLLLLKRIRDIAAKNRNVRFHILHGSRSVFGYPNNRASEWCPVPIDSDKRRSTLSLYCIGPGEDMDVCKCIAPSRHGDTLNCRRAANPIVRLVEGVERWEASDHP
ncbi:uncharacterized protein TNCV_3142131 [Trichonephila clavipes]|nr:uncharacterized protein TNCV_3142131 [Trichonephila clavipes]